jgi:phosphatidylserine decarboxylase
MALWRAFCELELEDTEAGPFPSLRAAFTRGLRPGARPIDPDPVLAVSPCDGIVMAQGRIEGAEILQIKGRPYPLRALLREGALERAHRGGAYVTLRLTASMYHRFHAPHDCVVERVDHVPGDVWNVNPPALRRVDRLYCRNERALVRTRLADGRPLTLVPVAAILVAGIRLHCAGGLLGARFGGPERISCDAAHAKGQEMGWFEHGSTIIVLGPPGATPHPAATEGAVIRMGRPLMRLS